MWCDIRSDTGQFKTNAKVSSGVWTQVTVLSHLMTVEYLMGKLAIFHVNVQSALMVNIQ